MDSLTLFNAYAEIRTSMVVIEYERGTNAGISVNQDKLAKRYQRRDRQALKIWNRLNNNKYCHLCGCRGGKSFTRNHNVDCSLWGRNDWILSY